MIIDEQKLIILDIYKLDKRHKEEIEEKEKDLSNLMGSQYYTFLDILIATPNNPSPYKIYTIILETLSIKLLQNIYNGLVHFKRGVSKYLKETLIENNQQLQNELIYNIDLLYFLSDNEIENYKVYTGLI